MKVCCQPGVFLLFALTLMFSEVHAQSPEWLWANRYGHRDNDAANDITLDSAGNVITVGAFRDTVNFDSGSGSYILIDAGGDD